MSAMTSTKGVSERAIFECNSKGRERCAEGFSMRINLDFLFSSHVFSKYCKWRTRVEGLNILPPITLQLNPFPLDVD